MSLWPRIRQPDEEVAILLQDESKRRDLLDFYNALFPTQENPFEDFSGNTNDANASQEDDTDTDLEDDGDDGFDDKKPDKNTDLQWLAAYLQLKYTSIVDAYCTAIGGAPETVAVHAPAMTVFTHLVIALGRDSYASLDSLSAVLSQFPSFLTAGGAECEDQDSLMRVQLVYQLVGRLSFLYTPVPTFCRSIPYLQRRILESPAAGRYQPRWAGMRRNKIRTDGLSLAEFASTPLGDLLRGLGYPFVPAPVLDNNTSGSKPVGSGKLTCLNLNYHTLSRLARLRIVWTDDVAGHLDFDPHARTFALFRYPTFCALMAQSNGPSFLCRFFDDYLARSSLVSVGGEGGGGGSNNSAGLRSGDFFTEVLYSYRLLFGQSKHARQAFRGDFILPGGLSHRWISSSKINQNKSDKAVLGDDPLLADLCGRDWSEVVVFGNLPRVANVKNVYSASSDFPYLGGKLMLLHDFVEAAEPDTWRAVWYDRRNLNRYYTMRIIAITLVVTVVLGISGLAIGIAQVVS